MDLIYDSLNEQLLKCFPVLNQPRYTDLIGGIDAGPYVIFGVLFNQYLSDLAIGADLQAKIRVASFIEDMAAAKDERVSDMLTTEVLPTFMGSQTMIDAYWTLLGTATRRRLKLLRLPPSSKVDLPAE